MNTDTNFDRRRPRKLAQIAWIAVALTAAPVLVFSQTTQEVLANLAQRIAEKRSEVESLSNEVELAKAQYNEQLRSLATQTADVEAQINREKLQLQQINQDIERARKTIQRAEESVADVDPLINRVLARHRTYINNALPFQQVERLKELDSLERLYADGSLEAPTMLTRLWNMVESEFRLTQESGLYRQNIEVDGEYQLAEVVRLGMVMLYFKTFDDQFGYAFPVGNGQWKYTRAQSRQEKDQIANLFDSMRRNLREGLFYLPNPYVRAETGATE